SALNTLGTTTNGPGSTFTISSGSDHDFDSREIVNNGTVNWTSGRLRSGHGGTFTNNSLFVDAASSDVNNDFGSTVLVFTNATSGTYNKTAAGTTLFAVPFNNNGTVTVTGGTLEFFGGGTNSSTGVINGTDTGN